MTIPQTALVCASCRRPVERTLDDDFQHESLDDGLACTAWPVVPARAGEDVTFPSDSSPSAPLDDWNW